MWLLLCTQGGHTNTMICRSIMLCACAACSAAGCMMCAHTWRGSQKHLEVGGGAWPAPGAGAAALALAAAAAAACPACAAARAAAAAGAVTGGRRTGCRAALLEVLAAVAIRRHCILFCCHVGLLQPLVWGRCQFTRGLRQMCCSRGRTSWVGVNSELLRLACRGTDQSLLRRSSWT